MQHIDNEAVPSRLVRQLEILARRSLDLADRAAAGELGFIDAVDLAYSAAICAGLPEAIDRSGALTGRTTSDDVIQATIAAAFANARRPS